MRLDGGGVGRLGGLAPAARPGGDRAAREPGEMGVGALAKLGRLDARRSSLQLSARVRDGAAHRARDMPPPVTSSMGRLFDAVAGFSVFQRAAL